LGDKAMGAALIDHWCNHHNCGSGFLAESATGFPMVETQQLKKGEKK
jgi:hypothetical protein